MADQWTPLVFRKQVKTTPKSAFELAQAVAKGQVKTVMRPATSTTSNASKLDSFVVGDAKKQTVTLEFKLALSKARQAKGLSQADLAKQINQTQEMLPVDRVSITTPAPHRAVAPRHAQGCLW